MPESHAMPPSTETLSQRAYQHIQKKLLAGEWRAGDVLSELSVAQEMGISRTPVREAFRTMEQEGVLEQVPRFGTRVKALDRRDLVELYELREALEPYAVAQAAGKLSEADHTTLTMLCEELKTIAVELRQKDRTTPDAPMMKRLMSADLAFHQILIRAAGNRRMLKIVADGRVLARIFMTLRQEHNVEVIEETHQFHSEILAAVESGRGDAARKLMARHIRASMMKALETYDQRHAAEAESSGIPLGIPDDLMHDLHRTSGPSRRPRPSRL